MVAITGQMLIDEIRRQQKLSQSIAEDQSAISSTKKLKVASDDPQAWVQISEIGRQQASQGAWTSNVSYAQARAAKAEANLDEMNTLFTRARELIITAGSTVPGEPGNEAVIKDLQGIRQTLHDMLNDTDFQGTPVFDNGDPVRVPVSRGLALDVVATRQNIAEGVDVNGTSLSLDDILGQAIASVTSGDSDQRQLALTGIRNGLDHIIVRQSEQGIRGKRLDDAATRLQDSDLVLAERRSKLEDTDLTETLTRLQAKLTTLQAAQAAFAKINGQTLFDLLR